MAKNAGACANWSAAILQNMLRWVIYAGYSVRDLVSDCRKVARSWAKLRRFGQKLRRFGPFLGVFRAFLRGDFQECARVNLVYIAYFDRARICRKEARASRNAECPGGICRVFWLRERRAAWYGGADGGVARGTGGRGEVCLPCRPAGVRLLTRWGRGADIRAVMRKPRAGCPEGGYGGAARRGRRASSWRACWISAFAGMARTRCARGGHGCAESKA